MPKMDPRLEVLKDAQRSLTEANDLTPEECENLLKLLHILIEAAEKYYGNDSQLRKLAGDLISNHSLLMMLQQHTDELDALKKLSLNTDSWVRIVPLFGMGVGITTSKAEMRSVATISSESSRS